MITFAIVASSLRPLRETFFLAIRQLTEQCLPILIHFTLYILPFVVKKILTIKNSKGVLSLTKDFLCLLFAKYTLQIVKLSLNYTQQI